MRHRSSPAILAAAFVLGCSNRTTPDPPPVPLIRALDVPAQSGSGEANLTTGRDGRLILSWLEPQTDARQALKYATRAAGGAWSAPRTIAEGDKWFVNWADFPSVASLSDGTLFAHWLQKSGNEKYAYDVKVSSSRDGDTWSAPVTPHRDGTPTEHGFVSMTPWDARSIGLVWLDGRRTAEGSGHEKMPSDAAMSLVHTTLAADGALGEETVLDARVCDCCQTDAVRAGDTTLVVYRDRSDKEIRDMSVVRWSSGRWSEPRSVARDDWEINGCPVNGPAIAARARQVAVAWFTAPNDRPRVRVAFSSNLGDTFGAPITVDDGKPIGRVDIALLPEAAVVSWLEETTTGADLRVRRIGFDGQRGSAITIAGSGVARSTGFPRMVESNGEIVLVWRDADEAPKLHSAIVTGLR
jgi:hypothetical protein